MINSSTTRTNPLAMLPSRQHAVCFDLQPDRWEVTPTRLRSLMAPWRARLMTTLRDLHLATTAIQRRLLGRRERKLAQKRAREFRKNHHFDSKLKRWVRNVDQVALIDHSAEDHRIFIIVVGWLLSLFFGRAIGFWKSESNTSREGVSNCPMCSCFSCWSATHSPCIYFCSQSSGQGEKKKVRRQSSGQGRYRCPAFRQSPGGG